MKRIIKKYRIKETSLLEGGRSYDIKHLLIDETGKKYVLRESPKALKHKKYAQYCYLEMFKTINANIAKVVEWGFLENDNIYMLFDFIEGENALNVINTLNDEDAYKMGYEAGKTLKDIHDVNVIHPTINWLELYEKKIDETIKNYENSKIKLDKGQLVLDFYKNNLCLVSKRNITYVHGDYHAGNMIVYNKNIGIIDFDKTTIADPYSDFRQCCWNAIENEYFATGIIDGYFKNDVPYDFFEILKFYTAETLLAHLSWAYDKGEQEVYNAYAIFEKNMEWYDNFTLTIPTWYKKTKNFK